MQRRILAAVLTIALALPATAQERPRETPDGFAEGADLMQRGIQSLLQGLFSEMQPALDEIGRALNDMRPMAEQLLRLVDDIGNYDAPVMLENGDILIRRKRAPPKEGEIDL